jgi:hypothetical protein
MKGTTPPRLYLAGGGARSYCRILVRLEALGPPPAVEVPPETIYLGHCSTPSVKQLGIGESSPRELDHRQNPPSFLLLSAT